MYQFIPLGLLLIGLLALPPFGLLLTGYSLPHHLALFPISTEPGATSISWLVWGIAAILILSTISPFVWRLFNFSVVTKHESLQAADFPLWGWIALVWVTGSWGLAWTRYPWFQAFQPHTFSLLWLGYILTMNGFTYQRSNQCLLLDRPRFLGQLFLLSAGFWWSFEYLNQYVHNWHYVNLPEINHVEYFFYTSISFSTVLPAVLCTYEWLATFPRLTQPFATWHSLPWATNLKTGWLFLLSGSVGLGLIGIWPTLLFPLLWLCPLLILLGMHGIRSNNRCFHDIAEGDWRPIILSALAALVCGFWWELWNAYSLVHWEYTLPYVHAFKIFEMPVLGYAGYIPFGLTCLMMIKFVLCYQSPKSLTRLSEQTENICYSHEAPEL